VTSLIGGDKVVVEGGLNPETAEQWQDLAEHAEALEAQAPKIQAETLPGIS
jgi:hypothetical protein